jgi:glycosyltransferase involved in cell wall biosynthesis
MKKKVLIISYYYPPIADVGSQRALAFSKYLPEFGWEPYVLSVKNPDKTWCVIGEEKPPEGVSVFYTLSLFNLTWIMGKINALLTKPLKIFGLEPRKTIILNLFAVPDQFIGWIPLSLLKGLILVKKHNIDVILATCKPISCGIIGYLLKIITKKPFILDIRDPLSPIFGNTAEVYYKLMPSVYLLKKIEKYLLRKADKITVVTNSMKQKYLSNYPLLNNKINTIYNGFMEEYFSINPEPFDKFTIVYVGSPYLYHKEISLEVIFEALQIMFGKSKNLKENIQFLCVGENSVILKDAINKYGLEDIVKLVGYVSYQQAVEYIYKSSLFLVLVVPETLPVKMFDGLAVGIPMLVLSKEGEEANEIIRKFSNQAYFVKQHEIEYIINCIEDAYNQWFSKRLRKQKDEEYLYLFSRRNSVRGSSKILDSLLPPNP